MTNLFDFIKSAAEYSQETSDIVTTAYGIVNDMNTNQQKCAELVPGTVTKLASIQKLDGKPFLPDGFEKQAKECLADHKSTIKLLNNVLNHYGALKEAYDKLVNSTPGSLGTVGKTASTRTSLARDGHESKAMQKFTDLLVNI